MDTQQIEESIKAVKDLGTSGGVLFHLSYGEIAIISLAMILVFAFYCLKAGLISSMNSKFFSIKGRDDGADATVISDIAFAVEEIDRDVQRQMAEFTRGMHFTFPGVCDDENLSKIVDLQIKEVLLQSVYINHIARDASTLGHKAYLETKALQLTRALNDDVPYAAMLQHVYSWARHVGPFLISACKRKIQRYQHSLQVAGLSGTCKSALLFRINKNETYVQHIEDSLSQMDVKYEENEEPSMIFNSDLKNGNIS